MKWNGWTRNNILSFKLFEGACLWKNVIPRKVWSFSTLKYWAWPFFWTTATLKDTSNQVTTSIMISCSKTRAVLHVVAVRVPFICKKKINEERLLGWSIKITRSASKALTAIDLKVNICAISICYHSFYQNALLHLIPKITALQFS